jgi:hypothetical protein
VRIASAKPTSPELIDWSIETRLSVLIRETDNLGCPSSGQIRLAWAYRSG